MNNTSLTSHGALRVAVIIAITLFWACFCSSALAYADDIKSIDDIDNTPSGVLFQLGDDACWAGETLSLDTTTFKNDILAAGRSVRVNNSVIPGSARIAGQTVVLEGCKVGHSVTIAGQEVRFEKGSAQAAAMAGANASFSGTVDWLTVAASDVYINGTVTGDAEISADTVTIGPQAVIEGTLSIECSQEPVVDKAASIGELDVSISEDTSSALSVNGNSIIDNPLGVGIAGMLGSIAWGIVTFLVMALLCEWLGRKQTAGAACVVRNRTGAFIATGVIGAVAAPVVLIILCCTVVGLPVAGALFCALLATTLVGGGFACASLAPLIFKNTGRWKRVILLSVIVGACSALPVVGTLITVVGFVYLLGYILQSMFLGMKSTPTNPADPNGFGLGTPVGSNGYAAVPVVSADTAGSTSYAPGNPNGGYTQAGPVAPVEQTK